MFWVVECILYPSNWKIINFNWLVIVLDFMLSSSKKIKVKVKVKKVIYKLIKQKDSWYKQL